jgi:hypothetical protein
MLPQLGFTGQDILEPSDQLYAWLAHRLNNTFRAVLQPLVDGHPLRLLTIFSRKPERLSQVFPDSQPLSKKSQSSLPGAAPAGGGRAKWS